MTQLLNADALNDCIEELVRQAIQYSNKKRKPKAIIIVASDDKASKIYVNNKVKTGEKLGIDVEVVKFDESTTEYAIEEFIHKLNDDDTVDGIMLQLPIYEHLSS
jgi:methylenetetrahydrofolate dehydrogenase (NADP+)/methenyltetrahydrofolate cyclohydrolase